MIIPSISSSSKISFLDKLKMENSVENIQNSSILASGKYTPKTRLMNSQIIRNILIIYPLYLRLIYLIFFQIFSGVQCLKIELFLASVNPLSYRMRFAFNLLNLVDLSLAVLGRGQFLLNTLCSSYGHIHGQVSVLLQFGQRPLVSQPHLSNLYLK